ncbi:MAG: hypothetical protein GX219_06640 [Tissierellia bacterium]|nr:hypothetical protein [Tissierellia bacterium]
MKMFKNTGYYFKEASTLFKIDFKTNLLSILSMGLVLTILGIVISGILVGDNFIEILSREADIGVFYSEDLNLVDRLAIKDELKKIKGLVEIIEVDKEESLKEMEEVLGGDKDVLELFDENPFLPYFNLKVELDEREGVLKALEGIRNISHVRDNNEVVEKIKILINNMKIIGVFLAVAVSLVSAIVISHIIRQGIYLNRERIETLTLLGAPPSFIKIPFLIEGVFMSLLAGALSALMLFLLIVLFYSKASSMFLPLPEKGILIVTNVVLTVGVSLILGILGSSTGVGGQVGE